MAPSRRSDSTPDGDGNLQDRVERLEQQLVEQHNVIEDLRAEVRALRSGEDVEDAGGRDEMDESGTESSPERSVSRSGHTSGSSAAGSGGRAADQSTPLFDRLVAWAGGRSEDWLNYVGIGLLLFGLSFLFKYFVDRGWLVPVVRVGFGALLGTVLLVGGLRIYESRHRLRRVLLGRRNPERGPLRVLPLFVERLVGEGGPAYRSVVPSPCHLFSGTIPDVGPVTVTVEASDGQTVETTIDWCTDQESLQLPAPSAERSDATVVLLRRCPAGEKILVSGTKSGYTVNYRLDGSDDAVGSVSKEDVRLIPDGTPNIFQPAEVDLVNVLPWEDYPLPAPSGRRDVRPRRLRCRETMEAP